MQQAATENTSCRLTSPFAKGGIEGGFRHAIREEEAGADITASHLTSALSKGRMEEGLRSAIRPEAEVRQEKRNMIRNPPSTSPRVTLPPPFSSGTPRMNAVNRGRRPRMRQRRIGGLDSALRSHRRGMLKGLVPPGPVPVWLLPCWILSFVWSLYLGPLEFA